MNKIINKTMDRSDLLTDEAKPVIQALNNLIRALYSKKLYMSCWGGGLPERSKIKVGKDIIKNLIKRIIEIEKNKKAAAIDIKGPTYKPLPDSVDDARIPWYLYWEIFWVMKNGPQIRPNMRLLDAGGASSLFSCYLASLGYKIHSIDLNETLVSNAKKIAKVMDWDMFSYIMNMKKLDFEDEYFDHAYSICVFEHLNYETRQLALSEIARCLKPNGILSVTFDYRALAVSIKSCGLSLSGKNQLKTKEDIRRNFLLTEDLELIGNQEFYDNGKSYLVHKEPEFNQAPYTFGAIFLRKKNKKNEH